MALTVRRSKRLVYSTTAASPRALTSARMSATVRSMFSSAAASKASNSFRRAAKSASPVASRLIAIAILFLHRLSKGVDDRLQGFALDLQGCLIDDQPRRNLHDVLDRYQL